VEVVRLAPVRTGSDRLSVDVRGEGVVHGHVEDARAVAAVVLAGADRNDLDPRGTTRQADRVRDEPSGDEAVSPSRHHPPSLPSSLALCRESRMKYTGVLRMHENGRIHITLSPRGLDRPGAQGTLRVGELALQRPLHVRGRGA
jgi:hypothetical protein